MSEDEENDILKRLRSVRQKLQDSLDDDGASVEKGKKRDIELIEDQHVLEKLDQRRLYKAQSVESSTGGPRFKTKTDAESEASSLSKKEFKQATGGVSRKRIAAMQRQVRDRVESRKRITPKKKALLLIAIVVLSMPLFLVNTFAFATCRFEFDEISIYYREGTVGEVSLFLPVYNPSFIDAKLGDINFELWARKVENGQTTYVRVANVHTFWEKTIEPYTTQIIDFTVVLNAEEAGDWLVNLLDGFKLQLLIRNFKYNGMQIASNVVLPEIDLSSMIGDLATGIDLGDMGDSFGSTINTNDKSSDSIDIWKMATSRATTDRLRLDENGVPVASQDSVESSSGGGFELFRLGLQEDSEKFEAVVDVGFDIPAIEKFHLGPIKITNLNVSLWGPGGTEDYNPADVMNPNNYRNHIASLTTYDDNLVPNVDRFGKLRNTTVPLEVHLGGQMSYAGLKLTLYKDNIGDSLIHPSYYVDTSDLTQAQRDGFEPIPEDSNIAQFVAANKTNYPLWYFLYNALSNGRVESAVRIEELSIEIFGIPINNIQIGDLFSLVLYSSEPLFNINDLVGDFGYGPVGIIPTVSYIRDSIVTFGAGAPITPKSAQNMWTIDEISSITDDLDLDADDLLDSLTETFGVDSKITLSLGISLNNTFFDISLGLSDLSLTLINEIYNESTNEYESKAFAIATATNKEGGPYVGLNGINEELSLIANLTLFTGKDYAPWIDAFVRSLLETFTLDGTVLIRVGYLNLFKERYQFLGVAIPLELSALFGPEQLESIVVDAIRGAIEGLASDLGGESEEDENGEVSGIGSATTPIKFNNPFSFPFELGTLLALGNPVMSSATGLYFENMIYSDRNGKMVPFSPKAAQQVTIDVTEDLEEGIVEIDLAIPGLEVGEGFIPVHLGVAQTKIDILINSSTTYGLWTEVMTLEITDYLALSPTTETIDIFAKITLYESNALCSFLTAITEGRSGPSFSLKIDGTTSLNLSNVFIPDINLVVEIPDLHLSLDLQGLIDTLLVDMLSVNPNADIIGPRKAHLEKQSQWWDGNMNQFPSASQDFDFQQIFEIGGSIEILGIQETGWPDVNEGTIELELALGMRNHIMTFEMVDPVMEIRHNNGDMLAEVQFLNDPVLFPHKQETDLHLKFVLHKSIELQEWFNQILWDSTFGGVVNLSIGMRAMGCEIGPLTLVMPFNDLTSALGLDIATLFHDIIPLNEKTFRDSPRASQDMMDILGDFGILYFSTVRGEGESPIQPVGPLDYDNPMFTAFIGLVLAPAFNMSILNADLNLVDKNIYDRILTASGNDKQEAIRYSKIAKLEFNPNQVYANSTYDPNTDFNFVSGVDETNYKTAIDHGKPYYDLENFMYSGYPGYRSHQIYNSTTGEGIYHSYGVDDEYPDVRNTFSMAEINLHLYNISHGSFETSYPKEYWRAMGGPYFPIEKYGKEHGGYPEHKIVYHPHFSPINNLLGMVDVLLADADGMANLFQTIGLAGELKINLFSMNLTLSADSPLVEALMGSLMFETFDRVMNEYRRAINPLHDRSAPQYAFADRASYLSTFDDPSIPRYASTPFMNPVAQYSIKGDPLPGEFYTDLEMDQEAVIDDYPYIGLETRWDHSFAPGVGGETIDGSIDYMRNYFDFGTNINPYVPNEFYTMVPNPNYKPGLAEFGGDNVENFIKDPFYNGYKRTVQNWADSCGVINPYFESENLTTWKVVGNTYQYELIEDPANWPIRYKIEENQRIPTMTGVYMNALVPAFELGVLSAFGHAWNEDPSPGTDCAMLRPVGYIWINSTTFPPIRGMQDERFWEDNLNLQETGNAMVHPNSSWIMVNIRLFKDVATRQFLAGLANIFDINLNFYLDVNLNASLFGYEVYGIQLNKVSLGGYSPFERRCEEDLFGGVGGSVWGVPGADGTIAPPEDTRVPKWLPKEILPRYDSSAYTIDMDLLLNSVLDSITGDIMGLIFNNIDFSSGNGITITIPLGLASPLTLPAWLLYFLGELIYTLDQGYYARQVFDETREGTNIVGNYAQWSNWDTLIDLRTVGDIWTELNVYYDEEYNSGQGRISWDNDNPYYVPKGDMIGWFPETITAQQNNDLAQEYAGEPEIGFGETISLPDISATIAWEDIGDILGLLLDDYGILEILWDLAFGGGIQMKKFPDYLWATLVRNKHQMQLMVDGDPYTTPAPGAIAALLPPIFNYKFEIPVKQADVTFNIMQMLREGDMPEGYYHGNGFWWPGDRNYWYSENGAGPEGTTSNSNNYVFDFNTDTRTVMNEYVGYWGSWDPNKETLAANPPPTGWEVYPKAFWEWLAEQPRGNPVNPAPYTQEWYGFIPITVILAESGMAYDTHL